MEKAVNKNFRYERKFFIPTMDSYGVENILKQNHAFFREIFETRFINNIYFDSLTKKSFFDNVDGVADRTKYRIRWYGELFGFIENPILEVKIKKGLLGTKELYSLPSFTLDKNFNNNTMSELLESATELPEHRRELMSFLNPMLLNRYKRKYFSSTFDDFRATIDSEMEYYSISEGFNNFMDKTFDDTSTILELKYDPDKDVVAERITKEFPFRLTKSSKYTTGISALTKSNLL